MLVSMFVYMVEVHGGARYTVIGSVTVRSKPHHRCSQLHGE